MTGVHNAQSGKLKAQGSIFQNENIPLNTTVSGLTLWALNFSADGTETAILREWVRAN